jgi:hypothetical protein
MLALPGAMNSYLADPVPPCCTPGIPPIGHWGCAAPVLFRTSETVVTAWFRPQCNAIAGRLMLWRSETRWLPDRQERPLPQRPFEQGRERDEGTQPNATSTNETQWSCRLNPDSPLATGSPLSAHAAAAFTRDRFLTSREWQRASRIDSMASAARQVKTIVLPESFPDK